MFCPTCGTAIDGPFCPSCSPAAAVAGQAVQAAPAGLTENVASALCYALGILTGILFLVLAPYNQNSRIRFHAFQSLFFAGGVIVFWMVTMMVSFLLPFPLMLAFWMVRLMLNLVLFCAWLFVIVKTYNGDTVVLPMVGPMARSQAGTN
jgi:uncharacterized membrane protein